MKTDNHLIKFLPDLFFKQQSSYQAFFTSLKRQEYLWIEAQEKKKREAKSLKISEFISFDFSRYIPELMTLTMNELYDEKTMQCLHIEDWDNLTDPDSRTLRNMLKGYDNDTKPMFRNRSYDLLQYMSIALQFLDSDYRKHVHNWCESRLSPNNKPV